MNLLAQECPELEHEFDPIESFLGCEMIEGQPVFTFGFTFKQLPRDGDDNRNTRTDYVILDISLEEIQAQGGIMYCINEANDCCIFIDLSDFPLENCQECSFKGLGLQITECDDGGTPFPGDDQYTVVLHQNGDVLLENKYNVTDGVQRIIYRDLDNPFCVFYEEVSPPNCNPNCPASPMITINEPIGASCEWEVFIDISGFTPEQVAVFLLEFRLIGDGEIVNFKYSEQNDVLKDYIEPTFDERSAELFFGDFVNTLDAEKLNNNLGFPNKLYITVKTPPGGCFDIDFVDSRVTYIIGSDIVNCNILEVDDFVDWECSTYDEITTHVEQWTHTSGSCPNDNAIVGAEVSVTDGNGNHVCTSTTNVLGEASCLVCPSNLSYEVCVNTTCDVPCGLTAEDQMIIRQTIRGNLPDGYPGLAINGDVNYETSLGVSTLDILVMQQAILCMEDPNDPANEQFCNYTYSHNWCRFIPSNEIPANINALGLNTSPDECTTLTANQVRIGTNAEFNRFNLGDVDGSCSDCVHGDGQGSYPLVSGEDYPESFLQTTIEDNKLKIIVNKGLYAGFHFKIHIPQYMYFEGLETTLSNLEYVYLESKEELVINWYSDEEKPWQEFDQLPLQIHLGEVEDEGVIRLVGEDNFVLGKEQGIQRLSQEKKWVESRTDADEPQFKSIRLNQFVPIELANQVENMVIVVYNLNGTTLNRQAFTLPMEMQEVQLGMDLSNLQTGIYIIQYQYADGVQSQKVFIH